MKGNLQVFRGPHAAGIPRPTRSSKPTAIRLRPIISPPHGGYTHTTRPSPRVPRPSRRARSSPAIDRKTSRSPRTHAARSAIAPVRRPLGRRSFLSGQEEEEEDGRQVRPRMRGAPGRGRPDRWVRSYTHYHPLDGAQVLQAALLDGRRREERRRRHVFLRRGGHGQVRRGRREDEAAAAAATGGGQGGARGLGDHPVRPRVGSSGTRRRPRWRQGERVTDEKFSFLPFSNSLEFVSWALRVAEAGTESWMIVFLTLIELR
jgi:hypothetical protein